ncbi:venom protease-like [Cochliomyia hominivorax]
MKLFISFALIVVAHITTTVTTQYQQQQQQQRTVTFNTPPIMNSNDIPTRFPTLEEGWGYNNHGNYRKPVGGEVIKKGSWPWVALLGYDDKLSPFKCGGTLITARHVITAAHCLTDKLNFVRLGDHDLTTDNEISHIDIKIERMEKHPDYNETNGRSDIAILYLEHNVQLTESINPICMPTTSELRQKSYLHYTPFIAGWGKTMEGGISANIQQELQIPIFDNQLCRDRYEQKNKNFPEKQFDNEVLCAGFLATANGICQGDSGGSLMMPELYKLNYRFYLIGVLSHGSGCQRPEIPSLYTSTQYFIDWILEKVADTP